MPNIGFCTKAKFTLHSLAIETTGWLGHFPKHNGVKKFWSSNPFKSKNEKPDPTRHKILALYDHLPPYVDIFYLMNVDKKMIFLDYLPTSSFQCSLWLLPSPKYTQFLNRPDSTWTHFVWFGTIPILSQQKEWLGGVRKIVFCADIHYYLCWRRVGHKKFKNVQT